ncbi:MAG: hypothetical protein ABIH00_10595 [Armatimonadota bacterium]
MKKNIYRVKTGKFTDKALIIYLGKETPEEYIIPWTDIELVSLGVLHEKPPSASSEMSPLRKKVREVLFKESKQEQRIQPDIRKHYIIDIFIKDTKNIYRFDSAYINYRAFLDQIEYVTLNNFKKFLIKLNKHLKNVNVTPDMEYFINNQMHKIFICESIFDFEIYNTQYLKKLRSGEIKSDQTDR